jgi:hypothetical protein
VIGGIITSTMLTLVVVPVLYTYLDTWGRKVSAWFTRPHKPKPAPPAAEPVPTQND